MHAHSSDDDSEAEAERKHGGRRNMPAAERLYSLVLLYI